MEFTKENVLKLLDKMAEFNENCKVAVPKEYKQGYADAIKSIKFSVSVNMEEEGK